MKKFYVMDYSGHTTLEFKESDHAEAMEKFRALVGDQRRSRAREKLVRAIIASFETSRTSRMRLSSARPWSVDDLWGAWAAATAATMKVEEEAVDRSIQLLRSWLSPEQLVQFEKDQTFFVVGNVTGRRYRIDKGTVYNICELNPDGTHKETMCCVPSVPTSGHIFYTPQLPVGDVMLAQKMAIECCEDEVLEKANRRARYYYGGGDEVTASVVVLAEQPES